MLESWKVLKRLDVFNSKWFKVVKNTVWLPQNNLLIDDYFCIEANDSSMIAAIDCDNRIILKREYRFPVKEVLLELPAGGFENNEKDPLVVAKRELLEETGYVSDDWALIAQTFDCPNRCNNKLYIYLAKNAKKISNQRLDATESIDIQLVPLEEAVAMCKSGEICVNSCVHAILQSAAIIWDAKMNLAFKEIDTLI